MNKETAEKMLKNWEKHEQESDFPNKFINDLLEAQKVVERERSVNVYDACIKAFLNGLLPQASAVELKERFHKELLESFRQEILQSTKE